MPLFNSCQSPQLPPPHERLPIDNEARRIYSITRMTDWNWNSFHYYHHILANYYLILINALYSNSGPFAIKWNLRGLDRLHELNKVQSSIIALVMPAKLTCSMKMIQEIWNDWAFDSSCISKNGLSITLFAAYIKLLTFNHSKLLLSW